MALALAAALVAAPTARAEDAADPPAPTANTIGPLLAMLAKWQAPDGSWDSRHLVDRLGLASPPEPALRTTALATLAFLGAGYDHRTPNRYRAQLEHALAYLLARQRPDGGFADDLVDESCAVTALAEALAMTGDEPLTQPARRAIDALLARRRLVGGHRVWTVALASGDAVDTRVLRWCTMALVSADAANLLVEPGARKEVVDWVLDAWAAANPDRDRLDPARGRCRFPARVALDGSRLDKEEAVEAALAIIAFARPRPSDAMIATLLNAVGDPAAMLPDDREAASLAFFQLQRKGDADDARRLRSLFAGAGLAGRDRERSGWSWPSSGARSGGRLSATAYTLLVGELSYRYAQVSAADAKP